jgi:hypothetical protein
MASMNLSSKQKVLAFVAVVAVGAGGAVAAMARTGQGRHKGAPAAIRREGARHSRVGPDLAVATGYLGLTVTQLQSELRSGRTLAQVAAATSGRTAAGLIDALVNARQAKLSAAVAKGELSRRKETAIVASLRRRVTAKVNRAGAYGLGGMAGLAPAARYLGLGAVQLREQLRSGRTLAQIADATIGRSATSLIDALVSARTAKLAAAVAAGALTQAQERARVASLTQRVTAEVNRVGGFHLGAGLGGGGGLAAAARYLGLSAQQLRSELRSGRTLAQLASATSGKSPAGLMAALTADRRAKLDAAVRSGKLTSARASRLLASLARRMAPALNGPSR